MPFIIERENFKTENKKIIRMRKTKIVMRIINRPVEEISSFRKS
jgi:hypothetical protein